MWKNTKYKPVRQLGRGYQSKVWYAIDQETNKPVTVKAIDLSCIDSPKSLDYLRDEQKCLRVFSEELGQQQQTSRRRRNGLATNCENIYTKQSQEPTDSSEPQRRYPSCFLKVAKLINVFYEPHRMCEESLCISTRNGTRCLLDGSLPQGVLHFVFEFIPGAPLNKHVAIEHGLSEARARFHAAELVCILGALHERGYIYRDLKASNVIIQPNGRLRLIDFGFTVHVGPNGRTRSFCGTIHAMAPEIFHCLDAEKRNASKNIQTQSIEESVSVTKDTLSKATAQAFHPRDGYGVEVDWWALGILLFEMLFCRPPFGYYDRTINRDKNIQDLAAVSPESLEFPEPTSGTCSRSTPAVSAELKDLLVGLLQADPTKRLGSNGDARAVQNTSWFQNFPWEKLDDDNWPGPNVHQFNFSEY